MSASAPPRFTATVGSTCTPSSAAKLRHVDVHAAPFRDVHAIQRQHRGQSQALHFQREAQADGQVHGVDHADHEVRSGFAGHAAQQHVARDGLVQGGGIQRVGARQVEHAQRLAVGGLPLAFAAFDRDARVVSHLLAAAGEAVEQRGLAAVRHADQRDAQRR
jgi:hypothetical protein